MLEHFKESIPPRKNRKETIPTQAEPDEYRPQRTQTPFPESGIHEPLIGSWQEGGLPEGETSPDQMHCTSSFLPGTKASH